MPLSRLVLVLTPGRGRVDRPLLGVLSPIAEQTPVSCASASGRLTDPSRNVALSHTTGPCWQSSAGLPVASSAQGEDAIIALVSAESGKCLQSVNGSLTQGDAIVQETYNGSVAQQWTVASVSSTKVHLVNRSSNLCLDARGGAANGTPIQQWTCDWISNENWSFGITNNLLSSGVSNTFSHCVATPGVQAGLAMELRFCDGDPAHALEPPQRMRLLAWQALTEARPGSDVRLIPQIRNCRHFRLVPPHPYAPAWPVSIPAATTMEHWC